MPLTNKIGILTNKMRKNLAENIISALTRVLSWKFAHESSPSAEGRNNVAPGAGACEGIQAVAAVSDRRVGTPWRATTKRRSETAATAREASLRPHQPMEEF